MGHLQDLWNVALQVFSTGDLVRLGILVVVLIGAGWLMQSFSSIVNTTFLALVVFVVAMYAYTLVMGGGQDAMGLAQSNLDSLFALDVKTLLGYAVSFAVVIAIVSFIKSAMGKG